MAKEIPVYIFMGFLESGKTMFANDTLLEKKFTEGDKTLLLVCEEGVQEYDEEELKKNNIYMEVLEEADLETEYLLNLQDKYSPEHVVIEYNGMWKLDKLFETRVPKGWTVVQVITMVNASTFPNYLTNMRTIMMEQLSSADMIIFNRCDENTNKAECKKTVITVNQRASIIFENKNGDVELDEVTLDLPYDIEADVIHIEDKDFGIFYIDAADNPSKYIGKTVEFTGMVYKPKEYKENAFVPGRFAMTCCIDDIAFIGFKCEFKKTNLLEDKEWVKVRAIVKSEFYPDFQKDGPVLDAIKVKPTKAPKESIVYFN